MQEKDNFENVLFSSSYGEGVVIEDDNIYLI